MPQPQPLDWSKISPKVLPWALVLALVSNAVLGWRLLRGVNPPAPRAQSSSPAVEREIKVLHNRLVQLEERVGKASGGGTSAGSLRDFFTKHDWEIRKALTRLASEQYLEDRSARTAHGLRLSLPALNVPSVVIPARILDQFDRFEVDLFPFEFREEKNTAVSAVALRFLPTSPLRLQVLASWHPIQDENFPLEPCDAQVYDENMRRVAGFLRKQHEAVRQGGKSELGALAVPLCEFVRASDLLPDRAYVWSGDRRRDRWAGSTTPSHIRAYTLDWDALVAAGAPPPTTSYPAVHRFVLVKREEWLPAAQREDAGYTVFHLEDGSGVIYDIGVTKEDIARIETLERSIIDSLEIRESCWYVLCY